MINKYIIQKFIFFLFLFLPSCTYLSAQNYQITYEVQFKPEKEKDSLVKEYMALKIINNQSIFYNLNKEKIDSLVSKLDYKGVSLIKNSFLRIKVFKDFSKDYCTIGGNFNQFNYWYKEKKINFYNLKKHGKYKNYMTSEAFADYGKREWHLLYTNDIPINDGPYVFSGLPGLVIKAESLDGDYSIELIEIKKLIEQPEMKDYKENIRKEKLIKNINDFIKDPAAHNINFKNDLGDGFSYEFSGTKDKSYTATNEYLKKIFNQFNNYPDKDIPIITF
ncbi:GLPGLI family protein [Chryseobacterium oleae]|uniref:GLPGLI family protein n=2 Tax=Chryseobacterium oleae TaxID=491207 RepID=A0A1I5AY90_CHROL|nr:GLPGLI family protein [Chryseobacterium oleae]